MTLLERSRLARSIPIVLVAEDDPTLAGLVEELLVSEGYEAIVSSDLRADAVQVAVDRWEPDCVLLDSSGSAAYGHSWDEAASLTARARPIPVIMFSAHWDAEREAKANKSARSHRAGFSGVIGKPFDLDDLLNAVAKAVGEALPVNDTKQRSRLVLALRPTGTAPLTVLAMSPDRRAWLAAQTE